MITLDHICIRRGERLLIDQANLSIQTGQNVGVTGANGTGKSSLFELILGRLEADHGELSLPKRARIGHLSQDTPLVERTALDFVLDGDMQLRALETELAEAEADEQYEVVANLHEQLGNVDAYTASSRAAQLLHGLGFSSDDEQRAVNEFSGGWRIRLNLAQVLMCPGEFLLLDEPTNHLDLDTTVWLEQWLQRYDGTLLLISHDRDFLDKTVNSILHIEHQQLTLYRGNYSAFEHQRAERLANQQAMYEKQQQRIKSIETFVSRFRAKATKAKQAQSRLKELNRMQQISAAHVDSEFSFRFLESPKMSDPLLSIHDAAFGYDEEALLNSVKLNLHPGDRIGLLGANGAGKSTLIKGLTNTLVPLSGTRTPGEHLRIGYFAQHQLEALDLTASAFTHIQRLSPRVADQDIRNFLGGFNFHGDRALESIQPFSGGEKARVALAMIVWQKPNLLLLDEPTNHLDLEMRHALTFALQEFTGAMLIVSHDRHLLRNSVDEFWLVANGAVSTYPDDLDSYEKQLLRGDKSNKLSISDHANQSNAGNNKARKQQTAAERQRLSPLKKELKRIESQMEKAQKSLKEITTQLADTELYAEERKDTLQELLKREGILKQEISSIEEHWLTQLDLIEEASKLS